MFALLRPGGVCVHKVPNYDSFLRIWLKTRWSGYRWPEHMQYFTPATLGRLLSDAGELFVANPAEAEINGPLPAFDGPETLARDAARRYYEFAVQLAPLGMKIASVDVSDRHSWSLRVAGMEGGTTRLELGRDTDALALNERMAQIVAAYPMVAARVGGTPASIDARYPNGLAASPPAKSR